MASNANSSIAKVSNKHIPYDVSLSILSKLSVKSLTRFECVSKSWSLLNLFQNTQFMTMFNNNFSFKGPHSLLLQAFLPRNDDNKYLTELYALSGEKFESVTKLEWPNTFHDPIDFRLYEHDLFYFEVFGFASINGIVCLLKSSSFQRGVKTVLWNPATKEFKIIPPSYVETCLLQSRFLSIPWSHFHVHGFGYDNVTNDYKVIRYVSYQCSNLEIYFGRVNSPTLWEIYSLRDNSWRILDIDIIPPSCLNEYVYIDGMCHWLANYKESPYELFELCLVTFKLNTETFVITPIPYLDYNDYLVSQRHLSVLYGTIGLMSYHEHTETFHISILCELGEKESWTKLFVVGPFPFVELSVGLGIKPEMFLKRRSDGKLIRLDLNTKMVEEFDGKNWRLKYLYYQENLRSVQGLSIV